MLPVDFVGRAGMHRPHYLSLTACLNSPERRDPHKALWEVEGQEFFFFLYLLQAEEGRAVPTYWGFMKLSPYLFFFFLLSVFILMYTQVFLYSL